VTPSNGGTLRRDCGKGKPFAMSGHRAVEVLAATVVTAVLSLGCTSLQGARAYREGNRALERGQPSEAMPHLERAAMLLPGQSEIHNHLGLALVQTDRLDEAVVQFERAVDLDCDNRAAEANLILAKEQRARLAADSRGAEQETAR